MKSKATTSKFYKIPEPYAMNLAERSHECRLKITCTVFRGDVNYPICAITNS